MSSTNASTDSEAPRSGGIARPYSQRHKYNIRNISAVVSSSNRHDSDVANAPGLADVRETEQLEIKHGMLPSYTLRLGSRTNTVIHYPTKETCTVLHSKGIHRYVKDQLNESFELTEVLSDVKKLLHAPELGVYVGVSTNHLTLLNRSFENLFQVETPTEITAAIFNSWSGEVVTTGPGNIMVISLIMFLMPFQ